MSSSELSGIMATYQPERQTLWGTLTKRNEEQGEGWSLIPHHHEDITFYIILSRTDVGVSQIDSNTKKKCRILDVLNSLGFGKTGDFMTS